eukprot:6329700-Alexandrium_andersonii.AAC.1
MISSAISGVPMPEKAVLVSMSRPLRRLRMVVMLEPSTAITRLKASVAHPMAELRSGTTMGSGGAAVVMPRQTGEM